MPNFTLVTSPGGLAAGTTILGAQDTNALLAVGGFTAFAGGSGWVVAADDTAAHGFPVKLLDGADATQGAKGDAAVTDPTASGSVIALLKGVIHQLETSIQVNAGTNLNTSALALETGGNLAAAKADLDTIAGAVSGGHVQATIATALPAGTNVIGHTIVDSGTITTVSTVTAVTAITNALPAGTNVIGHVIVDSGTITTVSAVTAITNALPAGTNVIGHVIVDSGTVTTVSTVTAVTTVSTVAAVTTVSTVTTVGAVTSITNPVTVVGDAANGAAVAGNPVLVAGSDGTDARTLTTDALGNQMVLSPGLQNAPITLFDQTTNQAGTTQSALFFPTTVALSAALPAVGSGNVVTITNSSNICGAIFAPKVGWDSVLLDLIGVGGLSTNTITIEIGRLKASVAVADVLASAILSGSTTTLGATTVNPLTGATGHSSVTWRFIDAITLTTKTNLAEVLIGINGVVSLGPSQMRIQCHDAAYYYVLITALHANWTEILSTITPVS
jgi:hypothetical protein